MKRIIGVDCGTKRVGVAISDTLRMLATPHAVFGRSEIVEQLMRIVDEYDVGTIVIGLPTSLGGSETGSAVDARNLGEELQRQIDVEIVFSDERFTTRMAEGPLLEAGMSRRDRRATIDKVAAAIILQDYLDNHR